MILRAVRSCGLLLAAGFLHASTVFASHPPRMPEVLAVIADDGDPNTVALATRYGGHYLTRDGGASWLNVCHEALGSDDTETYGALFTSPRTLVAATGFRGVASSLDGCNWVEWSTPDQSFVTDVAGVEGGEILALDLRAPPRFWSTRLDSHVFVPYGTSLPADVAVTSMAAARDGSRLYVAGKSAAGPRLVRSWDGAASWETLEIPGSSSMTAAVVGVADTDVDLVVVKLDGESSGAVLVSRSGGESWETVHEAPHPLPAAVLSADGTLFFGGPAAGLFRGSVVDVGAGFERVSEVGATSLTASGDRLFAVTSQVDDGHSVALSVDGGRSFAPYFDLCRAAVTATCGAETTVARTCSQGIETMPWQPLGDACGATPSEPPPPPGTGGLDGAGGAGGASGTGGAQGHLEAPASSSCGMRPAPRRAPGALALLLLSVGVAAARGAQRTSRRTLKSGHRPAV